MVFEIGWQFVFLNGHGLDNLVYSLALHAIVIGATENIVCSPYMVFTSLCVM